MKSLIVITESAAPSFCYYPSKPGASIRMQRDVFEQVVSYAEQEDLALHIVCGNGGLPEGFRDALTRIERSICYVQPGAGDTRPDDIPVLNADDPDGVDSLPEGAYDVAILRIPPDSLALLPELWRRLSSRVYRIVPVLLGIETYDVPKLDEYEGVLGELRESLKEAYLTGAELELSTLSDRMILTEERHCNAGLEHLTVAPSGALYLCPGFAVDGADPVGTIGAGPVIPNQRLLTVRNAPLCSICDAFHCRRCVYLNHRITLEVNTPPWQLCRVSHLERDGSRRLLLDLHASGRFTELAPIPKLRYLDPLELFLNPELKKPASVGSPDGRPSAVSSGRAENAPSLSRQKTIGSPGLTKEHPTDLADTHSVSHTNREKVMLQEAVGSVTSDERDEIRELYMRKGGLSELFASLSKLDKESLDASPLYDKIILDMGRVSLEFQGWWDRMVAKYGWKSKPGKKWRIDFESCNVFLE